MRRFFAVIIALALLLPAALFAQEVASVTGVVTDTTGAVVPGVNVTLVNTGTNATYQGVTNGAGVYTIFKVLPGPGYKITFKKDGFESVSITDIYLSVGATRTQNAQMAVGKINETVEVSAATQAVTLDTTSATVGTNLDMKAVAELPNQFRDNIAALLRLQPGVVSSGSGSNGTGSRDGAVTGARADQNNVTLDGLDVNDFATGQAFTTIAGAPVDSIQEFRGETANSMAASGRGSGSQVQMVTKGGSNAWHGLASEYHRNTATAANNYFNNMAGVDRPKLIRNQFSTQISGPVVKDKLFFMFNYAGRRDARDAVANQIVPLETFRNGQIGYMDAEGGISYVDADGVKGLDPQGLGYNTALWNFIAERYPKSNNLSVGDGINTGGFQFNAPRKFSNNSYVSRVDYNMNSNMKLFGRFTILRQEQGDAVNYSAPMQWPGDPISHKIVDHSYAYVIGHTWTLNSNMVNQFNYGATVSDLGFPTTYNPMGTTQWLFGPLTMPFSDQSYQARRIPIPMVRDDFTWQRGDHQIQFGGTYKFIKTRSALGNDLNFVTMGLGGYTDELTEALRPVDILDDPTAITYWDDAFAFALGRIGQVGSNWNYDSSLNPLAQGSGAIRRYKYNELETYIQDTWKVNNSLTLTFGLRYQYYSVPYEVNGIQASQNFGFDEYLFGRANNGAAGQYGYFTTPITYYDLAGKANNARGLYEPDLTNFAPRIAVAYSPAANNGFIGKLFGDRKTVIRAGAGVIYDHTVTNALNFIQDQNSYMFQTSTTRQFGNTDAVTALANDPRFTGINSIPAPTPAPAIARPYAPFLDADGYPVGAAESQFNYAIDPKLRNPYSIALSFGIQRELPGNFVLETNYVGRLGRRLIAQADAAQLVEFKDPASGQALSSAFAALTQQMRGGATYATVTPQPFFENLLWFPSSYVNGLGSQTNAMAYFMGSLVRKGDISDIVQWLASNYLIDPNIGLPAQFAGNTYITNKGNSNYHGLLVSLHKNPAHGLQFGINYAFAHSIDNASGIANSVASGDGLGFICDAQNLRVCRGNSDFDVTHAVNGNFIYDLPFGKGRAFGSTASGALNQIIGGWSLSGVPSWRTGLAYTTVTGAYMLGYANNAPAFFNGDLGAIKTDIHQKDGKVWMFADPTAARNAFTGPIGFNMGSRNNLRGPGFFNLDLALSKSFPINERFSLKFRAEAYNALNHTSFALPGGGTMGSGADITSVNFGRISSTANAAREMQFGLRLEF